MKKDWMKDVKPGTFGALVRARRIDRGFSQVTLARKIGITQGWLSKIESGTLPDFVRGLVIMQVLRIQLHVVRKVLEKS